jgi:hypothetical protein
MVDTTYSDLILMIGGQVLTLFLLLLVTLFGTDPIASRLSMPGGHERPPMPPLPSASNTSNKNNKK